MTTVSVIIPAYNAEGTIGAALESVAEQTFRDIEVLVVDDGSTDKTLREAEYFGGSFDLTILKQLNAGPAAARNNGIRRARGACCAFLDADDSMFPDRLAAQLELLNASSGMGLVHSDLMTFDEQGIIHRTRHAFSNPCGGFILDRLLLDNFITTSTVMAPAECLRKAGLFNERRRVSEDFELWLHMASRWEVGFIDRPLVRYRRRCGSLSDDKLRTGICALEVIEAFWQENPDYLKNHQRVYSRSLAQHLGFVGAAALAEGKRGKGIEYLLRSLLNDPRSSTSWKSLAKTLLFPRRQSNQVRAIGTDEIT